MSARRASASRSVSRSAPCSRREPRERRLEPAPRECRRRRRRTSARSAGRSPRRSAGRRCAAARPSTDCVVQPEVEDRVEHARHRDRARRSEPRRAAGRRGRRAACRRAASSSASASSTSPSSPAGSSPRRPPCRRPRRSVVIVKPAGTRSGPSTRVISAIPAPLPPSRSRILARALRELRTHSASGHRPRTAPRTARASSCSARLRLASSIISPSSATAPRAGSPARAARIASARSTSSAVGENVSLSAST